MKKYRPILLLFCIFIFIIPGHAQTIQLQMNLKKEQQYTQTTNAKITVDQVIEGNTITFFMNITGGVSYNVKEVTENGYWLETSYDSLKLTMDAGFMNIEMNSEADENVTDSISMIYNNIMKSMIDKSFQVKMLKNGSIEDIKNIDNLYNTVFDADPQLPEEVKEKIISQLKKSYGKDAFKGNLEMASPVFPDHPVEKGDTWTNETALKSAFIVGKINTTFKLLDFDDKKIILEGNSVIKTYADSVENNKLTEIRYDLSGKMNNTMTIDRESGWTLASEVKQNLAGEGEYREQKVQMTMKSMIKMGGVIRKK